MQKKYWSAIFSRDTWDVFLKGKADTMGFRRKLKSMDNINKGDYFICYIYGVPGGRKKAIFAGILEVKSDYFFDEKKIWEQDIFPHRFKVAVIKGLELDNGIEVTTFIDKLELFKNLKNPKKWGALFYNAPLELTKNDGEILVKAIEEAK